MTLQDPIVTVALVTHNSEGVIGPCLASFPAAFGEVPYQVVVADNASTDGTCRVIRDVAPEVEVLKLGSNRGYAAGVNAAARHADASGPIFVLNPDVRLGPGSVRDLLSAVSEPGCGIAVPRIVDSGGRTANSLRRDPSISRALGEAFLGGRAGRCQWLGETVLNPSAYEKVGSPDWATGAAMLLSADCAAEVGPWDERFFLYSEETDFAIRARRAGLVVRYVPTAVVSHLGGQGNRSVALRPILVQSRIKLYAKYHRALANLLFAGSVALNEALRALAGREECLAALLALPASRAWTRRPTS